jgi:hypothetical protein
LGLGLAGWGLGLVGWARKIQKITGFPAQFKNGRYGSLTVS